MINRRFKLLIRCKFSITMRSILNDTVTINHAVMLLH